MAKERQRDPDTTMREATPVFVRQKTADGIADHVSTISLDSQNTLPKLDIPPITTTSNGAKITSRDSGDIDLSRITVKIADLGNACWTHHHFTNDIQTRQYRAPEVILGANWGASADCWSMACMSFELLTGDYLFDPKSGKTYDKDDDHIAQIEELLGHFPRHIALSGKFSSELFNKKGVLRKIEKLNMWSLKDVLHDKYKCSWNDAEALSNFLLPLLNINPQERASTRHQLQDPWIFDNSSAETTSPLPDDDGETIPGWSSEIRVSAGTSKTTSKNGKR